MYNLTTLASAVQEILLGAQKFKMGHVTLTTRLLRVICHPYDYDGTWHIIPVYEI